MRKIISVLLVALMLFSVVAVSASAVGCSCKDHRDDVDCRCCIYCTALPKEYIKSCAKNEKGEPTGITCCVACAGYYKKGTDCGCSCECCGNSGNNNGGALGSIDNVWGPEQQKSFVDIFQSILSRISEAFDNFWEAIKNFLKIDQVLPPSEN